MTAYVIDLPRNLPNNLFENLNQEADTQLRERLAQGYRRIPKQTSTSNAGSSKDALGHVFFRTLCPRDAQILLRMFRDDAEKHAFRIPKDYGREPRLESEVELTEDIACARSIHQTKAYFIARDLLYLALR